MSIDLISSALIGSTGYVGSVLQKQRSFTELYNSKNIQEIYNKHFDLIICSAAPAQKWIANKNPEADFRNIASLIDGLKTLKCNNFILISTVDVFKEPINVSEKSDVLEDNLLPYGLNRRHLEKFVESHFPSHLIVRLPGLVGPGLKKNPIFDFRYNNNIQAIDSRGVFQFYPMVNLWSDIKIAVNAKIKLIHFATEPLSISEIAKECFNIDHKNILQQEPAMYNFRSQYAELYEGKNNYLYSKKESILAIRNYAQQ